MKSLIFLHSNNGISLLRGVAKGGQGGHMPTHHFSLPLHQKCLNYIYNTVKLSLHVCSYTVPLDLNFTYARAQKATARNIHGNAPE